MGLLPGFKTKTILENLGLAQGTLGWNKAKHTVDACEAVPHGSDWDDNVYTFTESMCKKTSGVGVAAILAEETRTKRQIAQELTVGEFVIFDGKQDAQPIWLGRVMPNPAWGGQGVKLHKKIEYYQPGNVRVMRNEVGINVIWYEKIDINSDALDYHISRVDTTPIVQNCMDLIPLGGIKMHRTVGRSNPVPKNRRIQTHKKVSLGDYSVPRTRNQTSEEDWYDKEFGLKWKMDRDLREKALSITGFSS